MEEKTITKITIDNGVKITEYSDGSTIFEAIKEPISTEPDMRNFLQKTLDWYKDLKIKPFIQIRDLNKPEKRRWWDPSSNEYVDYGDGCVKEKPIVVIGLKMDF